MSVTAAVNPVNWTRLLLTVWAAVASLGVAYMGMKSGFLVGELRTTKGDLTTCQSANDDWEKESTQMRADLDQCEAQFVTALTTAERDALKREAELAALARRLQEAKTDVANTLQAESEALPDLAACLPLAVPAGTFERLRAQADHAARAHRDRAPGMDPGAGGENGAAALPGAPDHAGGVPERLRP